MPPPTANPGTLPTFMIIGAERCATRWLRFNLDQHPDIYTPSYELAYFNDPANFPEPLRLKHLESKKGSLRHYKAKFDAWNGERFVGESSPQYLMWNNHTDEMAKRIQTVVPDVRLIALVREPIDRMYSAVLHHIKRGALGPDADIFDMVSNGDPRVAELGLISNGTYGSSLYPYQQRFGDQLLILFYDDIVANPQLVYDQALAHIGASTDFKPRDLHKVMFSNRASVSTTVPPPTVLHRQLMYFYFRPDVDQLAASTGRDLSAWDPGDWDQSWDLHDLRYDAI